MKYLFPILAPVSDFLNTDLSYLEPTKKFSEHWRLESTIFLKRKLQNSNFAIATILENKILTSSDVPEKRHIELRLSSGLVYNAGDYLEILPANSTQDVNRLLGRLGISWETNLNTQFEAPEIFRRNTRIPAGDFFSYYVNLVRSATTQDINRLAGFSSDLILKDELSLLCDRENAPEGASLLDVLEKFPTLIVPVEELAALLPPMEPRQYSISSSPLVDPKVCSISVSVASKMIETPASTHRASVTASYLSSLKAGDRVKISIRKPQSNFHLPLSSAEKPIIMIATGAGIAPFRSFVMERAAQIATGRKLAPALLFFGCRAPGKDDLYADEFRKWSEIGAVDIRYAYSEVPEQSGMCRYVQDRIWHDRRVARQLFNANGQVFVCGSRRVGEEVKEVWKRMYIEEEYSLGEEVQAEDAEQWLASLGKERFCMNVFA